MIQPRFICLVLAASSFLEAHTMSISNRTSAQSQATQTTALETARNLTLPSTVGPHHPNSGLHRHTVRITNENLKVHPRDSSPTPAPDGPNQESTTVHVVDASNFAILLPRQGSHGMFPLS
jgi:hypothetical protein